MVVNYIFVTLCLIPLVAFIFDRITSSYFTHKSMINNSFFNSDIDRITYKEFVLKLRSSEDTWFWSQTFEGGIFSTELNSKFHANIIEFDKKGYIAKNPIEYYKIKRYIVRLIDSTNKSHVKIKPPIPTDFNCYKVPIDKIVEKTELEKKVTLKYMSDDIPL